MNLLSPIVFLVVLTLTQPLGAYGQKTGQFEQLASRVKSLVAEHYPRAQFEITEYLLTFRYDTWKFMIHEAWKTGEWQEARPQEGPNQHGILGEVHLIKGPYLGAAGVPQSFDKRYFTVLLQAPYSKKCDCHLHSRLFYPKRMDLNFVKRYSELIDSFSESSGASR